MYKNEKKIFKIDDAGLLVVRKKEAFAGNSTTIIEFEEKLKAMRKNAKILLILDSASKK